MKHLIILFALFTYFQVEAKQKFYKWTDEDGNIHYTEKKPQNKQIDEVKIYKSKPTPLVKEQDKNVSKIPNEELTAEQKAALEYNQAEQKRVQAVQDRENCKIAQQNKITLEKSINVKRKNPATGEYIIMNKTEVNKKLKEIKKSIKKLCK